jgi:DNA-binding NtrC family response regulator
VRELKNTIQRGALLAGDGEIDESHLHLQAGSGQLSQPGAAGLGGAAPTSPPDADAIETALSRHGGVIARAAADLGMSRQALYRRMDKLGIPRS